jgi:hypothetical protein
MNLPLNVINALELKRNYIGALVPFANDIPKLKAAMKEWKPKIDAADKVIETFMVNLELATEEDCC